MEPIVIRNTQSPGDIIVLTAAVRDIARSYPGRFRFGVDTIERSVWLHNPDIDMSLKVGKKIIAKYPLVHQSNQQKVHFMWGFLENLNQQLLTDAKLLDFRPALYLSPEEKASPPGGLKKPYWVFASGGKKDFTAKWWDPEEWKKVAASMSRWTTLVQVGGGSHVHPLIEGAVNMVGKTSFRDLMRLIYHSEGVLCVVTCLMHIAAAFNKPCVVIAGGREPYFWEAYTHDSRLISMRRGQPLWSPKNDGFIPHRFIHTIGSAPDHIGSLPCCQAYGCWSGRVGVKPAGDNHRYCKDYVVRHGINLPRCLSLITFEKVLQEVDWYYTSGILNKKGAPTMMEQMLLTPTAPKAPPPPPPPPLPPPPPAAPAAPPSEPEYAFELPMEVVQIGAMVNGSGINAVNIGRYERVKACLLQVSSRVKGLQAFMKQTEKASWVGWMEEPIYPRGKDWYPRLMAKLDKDPEAAWGTVCWRPFTSDEKDKLAGKTWYQSPDLPLHPLDPNRRIVYYLRRGWLLLPRRLFEELPWDTLTDADFELELSVWLQQRGVRLKDAGELVEG